MSEKPHRNEKLLRDLYIRQNLSHRDIADRLDVNHKTVRRWRRRFDLKKPWKDRDILYEMYIEDGLTARDIADRFNCRATTISKWLGRHDIETPDNTETIKKAVDALRTNYATFYTEKRGYEIWTGGNNAPEIYVHQLLAIAEYGLDAVVDKQIHHKNGIPWDNRPGNIEPLSNSDHQQIHGRENLWAAE